MAKLKHKPEKARYPKPGPTPTCRGRGTRTLATLQAHLTKDITIQVLDTLTAIAKGTIIENDLPQRGCKLRARNGTSRYSGASKQYNKWRAQIQRGGVITQLGVRRRTDRRRRIPGGG